MKHIKIDLDIHKMIEQERKSFEEPEHFALRRLLNLPEIEESDAEAVQINKGSPALAFTEDEVEIPSGSDARMSYQRGKQKFEGKFIDGYLVVNEKAYSSLSAAACDLAKTKDGKKTNLNGWKYWEVRFAGETHWTLMDELRQDVNLEKLGVDLELSKIKL